VVGLEVLTGKMYHYRPMEELGDDFVRCVVKTWQQMPLKKCEKYIYTI
jgi:hypothetical protein